MDQNKINLFGFTITKNPKTNQSNTSTNIASFGAPPNDDGALTISAASFYGTYVDLDGTAKNEVELITRYREMSMQPELETAIDNIVNEAICQDEDGKTIEIVMDKLKNVPAKVKNQIKEEFETIQKLLNYNNMAQDLFRRWYVDGRIYYHILIDKDNPSKGILELRYLDPRKIRKIRELKKSKDEKTGADVYTVVNEYYIYNEKNAAQGRTGSGSLPGVRIAPDSIINVNSGLMDSRRAIVLSYLHKAIKPLNQLRMIEDASIIYRIARAPERRMFIIDVGQLPKAKAEQYLYDLQTKYKNKLTYDSSTGQVTDDRKFMSMLEDFWIPSRGGAQTTKIETLPSGDRLGVMDDIVYFEKKLYKSLSVPISRLDPQQGFSLGRSTEITRDELMFQKFIERLRNRFSDIFDQALKIQCVLKGVCTADEWDEYKENIYYDFVKDNAFTELKDAELMKERLGLLGLIDPYTGRYYSMAWIRRNVLRLNDDEIEEMQKEIDEEAQQALEDANTAMQMQGTAPMDPNNPMGGGQPIQNPTGNPDDMLNQKLQQFGKQNTNK